jgi:WS/DGAT/MGAT family acyltransferase
MTRVDTAWLRMDTEVNLMMIVGVWTLDPPIDHDTLCRTVEERLLRHRRFRQKVVQDAMGALWVDDDTLDIRHHVLSERLALRRGQGHEAALRERIAELAATPLDPERPLWQFLLIEGMPDGTSRIIIRIHHCIGDGIALNSVLLSITDGGAPPPQRRARDDEGEDADWFAEAVLKPITQITVKAIGLTGEGVSRSIEMLGRGQGPVDGTVELARLGYQLIADAGALALMPDDSPTRLKGKAGPAKRVAWCEPLPLDEVKAIGKALGCSVNDVLLASAAGAIGGYLQSRGDDTHGQEIRAMVPVNLRPIEEAWKLGNRFGLVPLVLPIGIDNPVQRVYAVRARMAELKGSFQPIMAFGLLAVAGLLIKPVQHAMLNLFSKKATAVMTNVPGPQVPLHFGGSTLTQVMFWVPQSGDIGMGVSILSYGGGVQFGLITDAGLCPDPQAIIDRFRPEFDKLTWLALMLPWGGEPVGDRATA